MLRLNKKGNSGPQWIVAIILILVAVNLFTGWNPFKGVGQQAITGGTTTTTTTSGTSGSNVACPGISGVTMTVGPTVEKWATTSTSTEWHRVFLNGKDQGLKLDGSTMTVSTPNKVDVYYAENSSTYYSAGVKGIEVGCSDFRTSDRDGNKYELYRADTAPTISIFNQHNGNLNTMADNFTINSGQQRNAKTEITLTSKRAISPYGNLIVVLQGNQTAYKKLTLGSYTETTCPDNSAALVDSTGHGRWCYIIPYSAFSVGSNGAYDTLSTNVGIETQSGVNPVTGYIGYFINGTIQDEDFYRNTISLNEEYGVEDNDNTEVGFTSIEFGITPD